MCPRPPCSDAGTSPRNCCLPLGPPPNAARNRPGSRHAGRGGFLSHTARNLNSSRSGPTRRQITGGHGAGYIWGVVSGGTRPLRLRGERSRLSWVQVPVGSPGWANVGAGRRGFRWNDDYQVDATLRGLYQVRLVPR